MRAGGDGEERAPDAAAALEVFAVERLDRRGGVEQVVFARDLRAVPHLELAVRAGDDEAPLAVAREIRALHARRVRVHVRHRVRPRVQPQRRRRLGGSARGRGRLRPHLRHLVAHAHLRRLTQHRVVLALELVRLRGIRARGGRARRCVAAVPVAVPARRRHRVGVSPARHRDETAGKPRARAGEVWREASPRRQTLTRVRTVYESDLGESSARIIISLKTPLLSYQ